MGRMFNNSNFDGDISNWDTSRVTDIANMFKGSSFTGKNGGLTKWNLLNLDYGVMNFFMFNNDINSLTYLKSLSPFNCTHYEYNDFIGAYILKYLKPYQGYMDSDKIAVIIKEEMKLEENLKFFYSFTNKNDN